MRKVCQPVHRHVARNNWHESAVSNSLKISKSVLYSVRGVIQCGCPVLGYDECNTSLCAGQDRVLGDEVVRARFARHGIFQNTLVYSGRTF